MTRAFLLALLCACLTGLCSAIELRSGDVIGATGLGQIDRIDPVTGATEVLFFPSSLTPGQAIQYEDYLGLGPDGSLLLKARPIGFPGPAVSEVFKVDPSAGTATRLTRFSEAFSNFSLPLRERNPFFATKSVTEANGNILLMDFSFQHYYRIDFQTGGYAPAFTLSGFPPEPMASLQSGRLIGQLVSRQYEIRESTSTWTQLATPIPFHPELFKPLAGAEVAVFDIQTGLFQSLDVDTLQLRNLGSVQPILRSPFNSFAITADEAILIASAPGLYRLEPGGTSAAVIRTGVFYNRLDTYRPVPEPNAIVMLCFAALTSLAFKRTI